MGGVGQASPQGISGPIPPPSPHLGLAAVNELHGDPGAPRTQGTCPELGLYWGGARMVVGGGRRKGQRKEKKRQMLKKERMERKGEMGAEGGMGEDGQSQEKRGEGEKKKAVDM